MLLVTGLQLDFVPLLITLWVQPFSQFSVHLTLSSLYIHSFSMRILWETVSKAFLKPR